MKDPTLKLEWKGEVGLINRVERDVRLEEKTLAMANQLASGPWSLRSLRRLAWQAVNGDWRDVLESERKMQRNAGRWVDYRKSVVAFQANRTVGFVGA
ncbi:MAG: hypothetical protein KKC85_23230 [Gammaproteobacteria bacterium]|nr:hypothetical protein [Gammaproteobacteria bacterium]